MSTFPVFTIIGNLKGHNTLTIKGVDRYVNFFVHAFNEDLMNVDAFYNLEVMSIGLVVRDWVMIPTEIIDGD